MSTNLLGQHGQDSNQIATYSLFRSVLYALSCLIFFVGALIAQSITSGDIAGVVKDPSGAVLADASVTAKNVNTGISRTTETGGSGQYRFSLIQPGTYEISVTSTGFQTAQRTGVVVVAGQAATVDFDLSVASSSTTVNVTEAASVLQSENADLATTYNSEQVLNMPNPGSDLTYIAQTAPGVVMNTQSGYGNFSANGMPGTSNLFTINGQNTNDPYLNLNNSGASNLLLGSDDIADAQVINNAYSAQYGQYAGSQVAYTTKSGTNSFHGNAIYMWNGRYVNATDFFSNQSGIGKPFLNFNEWQTNFNGPVWKNRTFFDVDYEGARVVLPTESTLVRIPSPQFQAATLANLTRLGRSAEIPFYNQIFAIQNGALGAASASPVTTSNSGCGTLTALPVGTPCTLQFRTTPPNTEKEYLWSARVDHNFSDKDHGYVRVSRDNGFQPTYTDYFSPIFNASSTQPQMTGQVSESHTFSPTTVNQFNGSAFFYAAAFQPVNISAALQALPTVVEVSGSPISRIGGQNYAFPQGRRVFQYQIIDDFSKLAGKHTFRLGFSWLHDDVTELSLGEYVNGRVTVSSLADFYNGGGRNSQVQLRFPSATEQPLRFNTFGGYISDDWKVSDRLTLSLNLRLENYANPTCAHDCFSRLATTFTGSAVNVNTPYNQSILYNQHYAFPNTQKLVWEPRLGLAWRPSNSDKTVIRTGAGIFADELPGTLAQSAAIQTPGVNRFTIRGSQVPGGFGAIAPNVPNSLFTAANAANQAFLNQFTSGGTLASIQQAFPGFAPPSFTGYPTIFKQPTYYKWNFEIQQEFGWKTVLSVGYTGMHGVHIPINDNGLNAFCSPASCSTGFAGLPSTAPDPRFGTINQYLAAGVSSYNGLIVSLQRRLSNSLMFNLNYTWSHALDIASNGGLEQFDTQTNVSILNPQNPRDIRANYGSADQDTRHYISFGVVASDVFRHAGLRWGPSRIFGGWTLSSNIFYRTGLPFTVVDTNASSVLTNFGSSIFATPVASSFGSCSKNSVTGQNTPCLDLTQFAPSAFAFGNQGRNSFRGPNYFNMDLALMKEISLTEHVRFSFGAQAFNVLNHANFDKPVGDVNDPNFGYITTLVGTPTSILGAFVGGNNSPRFVEFRGVIRF